ncbi:hypothetical protein AB4Z39_28970, partial [Mycobacterium adipatum]
MSSALEDLVAALPEGSVVTDPDIVASYRQDRAADPDAGTALAVVGPPRPPAGHTGRRGGPPPPLA